jgi:hypothetical protein
LNNGNYNNGNYNNGSYNNPNSDSVIRRNSNGKADSSMSRDTTLDSGGSYETFETQQANNKSDNSTSGNNANNKAGNNTNNNNNNNNSDSNSSRSNNLPRPSAGLASRRLDGLIKEYFAEDLEEEGENESDGAGKPASDGVDLNGVGRAVSEKSENLKNGGNEKGENAMETKAPPEEIRSQPLKKPSDGHIIKDLSSLAVEHDKKRPSGRLSQNLNSQSPRARTSGRISGRISLNGNQNLLTISTDSTENTATTQQQQQQQQQTELAAGTNTANTNGSPSSNDGSKIFNLDHRQSNSLFLSKPETPSAASSNMNSNARTSVGGVEIGGGIGGGMGGGLLGSTVGNTNSPFGHTLSMGAFARGPSGRISASYDVVNSGVFKNRGSNYGGDISGGQNFNGANSESPTNSGSCDAGIRSLNNAGGNDVNNNGNNGANASKNGANASVNVSGSSTNTGNLANPRSGGVGGLFQTEQDEQESALEYFGMGKRKSEKKDRAFPARASVFGVSTGLTGGANGGGTAAIVTGSGSNLEEVAGVRIHN